MPLGRRLLPRRQPFRANAKACRARLRGKCRFGIGKKSTSGVIEVVEVLVVAEQHCVDGANLRGRDCRTSGLLQHNASGLILARRIERRIGQNAQASHFDQYGGAANQSDR